MTNNYIQQLFAERISKKKSSLDEDGYKFGKIKRVKKEAMLANPDMELIDLGIGEPDKMADNSIVEILKQEAQKPENRFYADNGIDELKQAAASYMENVFGVSDLNPDTEINHIIGSKSALAMLPAAFINPGDITLMPSPCYPVLGTHTKYYGGEVISFPLLEENEFLPNLNLLDEEVLKSAKLLYLNYPNNPTGAVANKDFFEQVVQFAKQYELIVVHDAAYAALVFDDTKPLSFLSIPGAKEVGVELHSLSKSFNMTGWRIGFIAGNAEIVKAFAEIKDNSDSGQFIPIQKAAAYALNHPEITKETALKYSRRHEKLTTVLNSYGFNVTKPKGSFFLYTKIPQRTADGTKFDTAEQFSQYLLREHLISTVPWDDVGPFVRLSVTFQASDIQEEDRIIEEIKRRVSRDQFIF